MKFHRMLLCVAVAAVPALFSSCKDKEDVKVYRVSKAQPEPVAPETPAMGGPSSMGGQPAVGAALPAGHPAMGGMPAMGTPAMGGDAAGEQGMTGNPPANWEAQPLSSMRQASYLVKGENGATADISIVSLAGGAGGVLENINRWLSQLGQPSITEEKLAQMATHIKSSLGDVTLVDLEGLPPGADPNKDGRIVAGIASNDGQTIFFKMRGNAALAKAQKDAFVQWIGTVKMREAGDSPAAPAMAPTIAAALPPATDVQKSAPKWNAPQNWKSVPPTSMRVASFAVAGQNMEALDISVSSLGGDGGGDLGNVNRWRGQIGLPALSEAELKPLLVPVQAKDGEILTVDMAGPKARVLAGWARIDGQSWFFKLTGPDALAAGERENFVKFLQSVQFHP